MATFPARSPSLLPGVTRLRSAAASAAKPLFALSWPMRIAIVVLVGFSVWAIVQLPPAARLTTVITLNFAIGLAAAIQLKRPMASTIMGGLFVGSVFCALYLLLS